MLNIGRMAPGGEGYYLATVADGLEDYYLGRGEAPGRWIGGGAADLGLSGQVAAEQLRSVLEGLDPETGTPLLAQTQRRVPGFDLTLRAPKSVSLLFGLADARIADEVRQAHDAAVGAAIEHLERTAVYSRRGAGGTEHVQASGVVGAVFRHRTSRAQDPLLHSHVLVANLARSSDDDRWRTLDSRRIYRHAKTAGYLYQAQLRAELTRRLGLDWGPVVNGCADVTGIPRRLIEAFSQRRAQILSMLEHRGEASAKAAQVATLETRQAKPYTIDGEGLRATWRQRAADLGFDPDALGRLVGDGRPTLADPTRLRAVAQQLLGPEGLTADVSTFDRRDVLQAWAQAMPTGADVELIERLADTLLDSGEVVRLDDPNEKVVHLHHPQAPSVDGVFSTPELLALEHELLHDAVARASDGLAQVQPALVDAELERRTLTAEQAEMVRRLTSSGAGVEVVVGKAGTGKTYALDAARACWQAAGNRVIGCALAGRAALELESSAGIDAYTIDRLLADVEFPGPSGGLLGSSVLVVDEAGMVGTRKLHRLLTAAQADDAKVVLVGDHRQLPELSAGGAFAALASRLDAVELTDNRRQARPWERDALDQLRHGDVRTAIDTYDHHDRIVTRDSAEELREQLVGDWWHGRTEHGLDAVMVAIRRADVDDLNRRARTHMAAAGELTGAVLVTATDVPLQAGDRIVCLKNDRKLGVVNGTRGTVAAVDAAGRMVTFVPDDSDRQVSLPARYLDAAWVTHGYAITGHKAQGLTCDATFVLGSDLVYREWGYVALSRGRQQNRLYTLTAAAADEWGEPCHERDHERIGTPDAVAELAKRLSRSHAQQTAVEQSTHELRDLSDRELTQRRGELRQALLAAARDDCDRQRQRFGQRRDDLLARRAELNGRDEANPTLTLLDHQLTEVERQLGQLPPDAARQDQSPRATALLALDDEIERRARAAIEVAAFRPPAYVTGLIGARPDGPAERDAWRRALFAVEIYRARYGIEDPTSPLGDRPHDLAQRHEHDHVARLLVDVRQQVLGPPDRENERQSAERSQALGR